MEEILRSLDYNSTNFYNENVRKVFDKMEDLRRNLDEGPHKNKVYLDIVSLLLELTDKVKIENSNDLEKESGHEWLFNAFLKGVEPDHLNSDNIAQILRMFDQISRLKNPNRNTVVVFSSLVRLFKPKSQQEKIDNATMSKIIKAFRVDIRMKKQYMMIVGGRHRNSDEEDGDDSKRLRSISIQYQEDQSRSSYRFSLEDFFDNLGQERFTILLPDIQAYYEHCIEHHNNIFLSYRFVADKLIRIIGYFKIQPPGSLYYDLPTRADSSAKLRQMIDLFKKVLTNANHDEDDAFAYYTNSQVKSFGSQILGLLAYEEPGYKMFTENWEYWFEACFEIFMKSTRNDSRDAIYRLDLRKIYTKCKFKDHKRLAVYVCQKLVDCVRFLNTNWQKIDEKAGVKKAQQKQQHKNDSNTIKSCLEYFYEFSRVYMDLVVYEVTDIKGCCKLCLDLIVELSSCAHLSTDYLNCMSELLYKDNFYVLKDYLKETEIITMNLVKLAYELADFEDTDQVEPAKSRLNFISKTYGYLKDRLSKFPESIRAVQPCLFEYLLYRPVKTNVCSEQFFRLITFNLFNLIDLEYLFSVKDNTKIKNVDDYQEKISQVMGLFFTNNILDTLQDEDTRKSFNRIAYFDALFTKLGLALRTIQKLNEGIIKNIIKIIEKIEQLDSYQNLFDSKTFTINYTIIQRLSFCLYNPNADERLVRCLLKIWSRLFQIDCDDFKRNYNSFVTSVAQTHGQVVADSLATQIYENYLTNMNEFHFATMIDSILPYSRDLFMSEYSTRFFDTIIDQFDEQYMTNYGILLKLFECCPEFYLQVHDNKLALTYFIERSKSSSIEHVSSTTQGLITQLLKILKEKNELIRAFYQVLMKHRNEFWIFVFNKIGDSNKNDKIKYELFKQKNFSSDWVINSIGEVYFLLLKNSSHANEDPRTVAKRFVDELLNYLLHIEPKAEQPPQIFNLLRGLGEYNHKVYLQLLKEQREVFVRAKTDVQTNPNAIQSVTALLDLIDDRNMETFSNKLNENEQSIVKINENLQEKGAEIRAIDESVRATEKNVAGLKEDVSELGVRVDVLSRQVELQNARIDELDVKTLFNVPPWCKQIQAAIKKNRQDWILIAQRLNFSQRDIKGWLNQIDPFMSMLQEWFLVNKTSDAVFGLMKVFKELNNKECMQIVQENIDRIEEESKSQFKDYNIDDKLKKNPAHVFVCYEAASGRQQAEILHRHLFVRINQECGVGEPTVDVNNRINIWFDDGRMGGGVARAKRIDLGLRLCNVLVCLITSKTGQDKTCLNQINLAIQLNKPVIPLLLDSKLKWPPAGSLGPILSEYLFIRFFQRPPKETTNDERYWPVDKFNELIMQLKQLIPFTLANTSVIDEPAITQQPKIHPEVFISYQWDKQKQIIKLYEKLTRLGLRCWLDIHQMGGGDSLYFKIDEGLRNCAVVISCVTLKYSQSANCRKEIALADGIGKPIVPILIEKGLKYPPPGPMSPTLGALKYVNFTANIAATNDEISWEGEPFNKLMNAMKPHLSESTIQTVTSRACVIS